MRHDQPIDEQDSGRPEDSRLGSAPGEMSAVAAEDAGSPVCYHQHCPVCGRILRIRVTLLGRTVYCQHCGGGFIASDDTAGRRTPPEADRPRATRVDELIERAALMLDRCGQ